MRIGILATALVCACAPAAGSAPPLPAEAYGRLPAIGSAAISPDGKRLAVLVGYEFRASDPDRELTALSVIEIDTGKVEHTLAPPTRNTLRDVGWADDRRAYYFISGTVRARDLMPVSMPIMTSGPRVEVVRTGVLSLDTGKMTLMLMDEGTRGNSALTRLQSPIEGEPGFGRMVAWGGLAAMGSTPRLAVTTARRWPLLPDVPTVAEWGVPGYEARGWFTIAGPAKIPADIIARLNSETAKAPTL